MKQIDESFLIADRTYGITAENGVYKVWSGGCCIGEFDTPNAARVHLHIRAIQDVATKLARAEQDVINHKATLRKLGEDPFYLGRFM